MSDTPSESSALALPVEGMTCAACATRIERRLVRTEGVLSASVNYATEEALVDVSGDSPDIKSLVAAVERAGYGVRKAAAESRIRPGGSDREALLNVAGVLSVEEVGEGEARLIRVEYVRGVTDTDALSALLSDGDQVGLAGEGSEADALEAEHEARYMKLKSRFLLAAALTVPVAVISMAHGILDFPGYRWVLFALTTPVVWWAGLEFFVLALRAARHGATDMNTLVAVGVGTAWGVSTLALVAPGFFEAAGGHADVYFEAAAVIVTLILMGRLLEERAKGRTGAAIRGLMKLQPEEARVRRGGAEILVPVSLVRLGDEVVIRPGERIPVDAEVIEGLSAVDESMVTGEPLPVDRAEGDRIIAGTINTTGALVCVVTRIGRDTLIRRIIELVRRAQGDKPPIQRLADRIAAVFVPTVFAVALVAAGVWWFLGPEPRLNHALLRFVTVLIIACPCALGLATPTAIVVATGLAARLGILVRDGSAVEQAGRVDRIAFDKTGTLTMGRPVVLGIEAVEGQTESAVLEGAAAAESRSEHPIARAIMDEAERRQVFVAEPSHFSSTTGLGVEAQVGGQIVRVGRPEYLRGFGMPVPQTGPVEPGATAVYVASGSSVMGRILVADAVRPTSRPVVAALQKLGVESVMLTGDAEATARHVAMSVGIDHVVAGILPGRKAEVVEELQQGGHRVAMVGDGINDAPALARANVGIAMGGGTDIAMQASDMTLMRSDPVAIVDAVRLSRRTMSVIRQNLFFAFVYNVICIPVAAGALYPVFGILLNPMIASAAMALSSVSVVSNSLRLRRFIRTQPDL